MSAAGGRGRWLPGDVRAGLMGAVARQLGVRAGSTGAVACGLG
ncbi:hypothetical protein ACUN22_34740 [Streptomyces anulatus]